MTVGAPEGWPPGVRPVSVQELDNLGINQRLELFWDGKEIAYKLRLNWWQNLVAALAAIASLVTIFSGLQNASLFLCARDVHILGCPPPSPPPSPANPSTQPAANGQH